MNTQQTEKKNKARKKVGAQTVHMFTKIKVYIKTQNGQTHYITTDKQGQEQAFSRQLAKY